MVAIGQGLIKIFPLRRRDNYYLSYATTLTVPRTFCSLARNVIGKQI